jgi:hypothetical protein
MAAKCGFTAVQMDERVRDQFVAWCANDRICERLLQKPDTKTLDHLLEIAVNVERALTDAPVSSSHPSRVSPADASVGRIQTQVDRKQASSCTSCGRRGHAADAEGCPARDKRCEQCQLKGHFAKCCRQRQRNGSGEESTPLQRHGLCRLSSRRRAGNINSVYDTWSP